MDRDELQMKLGVRIKKLRARYNFSQEQFAHRIGMDRSYFASIEVGKRNVTLRNLAKIAHGFRITPSELLDSVVASEEYLDELTFQPDYSLPRTSGNDYHVSPFDK